MNDLPSRAVQRVPLAAGALALMAAGLLVHSGSAFAATGDITEYPVTGNPHSIALGSDGNLWFTEYNGGRVAKVTTSGVVTEYPVPATFSSPRSIAAGPDGNLWFTDPYGNKVDKVTTSGVITQYSVPLLSGQSGEPLDIALGQDGNLWFTDYCNYCGVDMVAKVTTSGVFTEYPVPFGGPTGIAAGPDGNLWLTEYSGDKVARVTTSGAVAEYPIPTAGSGPTGITKGPDGNLWLTEYSANKVAKMTTAGVFTEYLVPTASSGPSGIAAGPDGNLWFTEALGNKVAEVTTSGVFTEYTIPTANSNPLGIAKGPDGKLWFTEYQGVAKIIPAGTTTTTAVASSSNPSTVGGSATYTATVLPTPDGGTMAFTDNATTLTGCGAVAVNTTTGEASCTTSYSAVGSHAILASYSGDTNYAASSGSLTQQVNAPSAYTAQSPNRLLDTRISHQTLSAGGSLLLTVAGGTTGVPITATGVVLNVTVTSTTASSFLTVWPAGQARPLASNLNWVAGETRPNLVNVSVGASGQVSIYNGVGQADVIVDEEGYFAAPSGTAGGYNALSPSRLLDTRPAQTMSTGSVIDLQILGAGGVPATGVSAVVLNVTATNTATAGFLTLYPGGTTRPTASNVNWAKGWTVANRVIVKVGANGKVSIYNGQGSADAVIDVNGYFTDATAAGKFFTPLSPVRVLDTRVSGGTIGPNGTYPNFQVTGTHGVPAGATAVFLNTTVTNTTASSFLTVYPNAPKPTASDLNWVAGQTIPNLTLATLSSTGSTNFYNGAGRTDLVLDLSGYFGP